ncbi:MAG: hypothetical protein ABSF15_13110 [Candidatus Sulfotelmatobacter sp.]
MLSWSAFAKDSHSANFTLSDSVQVGTAPLSPGNDKAEWTGPADKLTVNIMRHGKTVATTQGKTQDLPKPPLYDAVVTKTAPHDTKVRGEIEFRNRTEALALSGE